MTSEVNEELLKFIDDYKYEITDHAETIEKILIEMEGKPESLDEVHTIFRALHTIKGTSGMFGLETVTNLAHQLEMIYDKLRNDELVFSTLISEVTLKFCDIIRVVALDPLNIEAHTSQNMSIIIAECKPISEEVTLTQNEKIQQQETTQTTAQDSHTPVISEVQEQVSHLPKETGEDSFREKNPSPSSIETPCFEKKPTQKNAMASKNSKTKNDTTIQNPDTTSSIRVSSEKLIALTELVTELMTVQAKLAQLSKSKKYPETELISEKLERLILELRDVSQSTQMLAIGALFNKFKRLTRDFAGEFNKSISLSINGENTEVEKTIIKKLELPLSHLIKYCSQHDIENREERRKKQKPESSTIFLDAKIESLEVLLEIGADGGGINFQEIKELCSQHGINASEDQFLPGKSNDLLFSQPFLKAAQSEERRAFDYFQAVKSEIEQLEGSITLKSSPEKGTTFFIRIPLSLSILDGLIVIMGRQLFVIPSLMVDECVEVSNKLLQNKSGSSIINLRDRLIPVIDVRDRFFLEKESSELVKLVIVSVNSKPTAIIVDQIVAKQQVVKKNLGKAYEGIKEISGASFMADGKIALILDMQTLLFENTSVKL